MPFHYLKGAEYNLSYEVFPGILPENTLFIHGNIASRRWWYPTRDVFQAKLKNQGNKGSMICAEYRGCGLSEPPRPEDINMHVFADDFISLVRELNLGSVNLVGHSAGGLIAALMLSKAPELFKKVVLLDPVGAKGVKFDESMIQAFEQMKKDKDLVAAVIGSTIHQNDAQSTFFKSVVVEDAVLAVKTVGLGVIKALDQLDVTQQCSKIKNSTLVLHGEHDLLLPMQDSKAISELMMNSQFKIIPGQGHCANIENPKLFVELISDFLFV